MFRDVRYRCSEDTRHCEQKTLQQKSPNFLITPDLPSSARKARQILCYNNPLCLSAIVVCVVLLVF